ncbi:MAG: DUF3857 domain-containing protein [Dysgonomonas sp.]|nr:DUF3857 domain-containing protein [Dysgonomonas sp.]
MNDNNEDLISNAVAIVNNYTAVFSQSDLNNATYKVTESITILNKQGERYAHFYRPSSKFVELKDFSGTVKDFTGKVIKKIGKKDLITSSISEQMATDVYSNSYECKVSTFPYIIEYTYQEKWKNGILSYPPFLPLYGYSIAAHNATYKIELPIDMNLRYNSNFDCDIKEETVDNKRSYTFSAKSLTAIDYEPLAPPLRETLPRVMIAPSDFCYDSKCGNMSTWNDYGTWVSRLLKDRDILPEPLINKLKELTKDAKDDRQKVEILYKYLQDNSRYVSIQLGIGGFQPIEAANVAKSGFGDCKGLSNIMKAYLNAVGISSNYCEISMKESNLHKDFTNVSQTDHAILLVPLLNDSIWLECTSQKLPFGYIHDDIAGHDALVISENGGKICRLPKYNDKDNKKESNLIIDLNEDGSAKGKVLFTEHLHGYTSSSSIIMGNARDMKVKYINANLKLPKIQINNINSQENKSSMPSCSISADLIIDDFANKTGSRLFIPICPLNKGSYDILKSNTRKLPIQIINGFSESDSVIINVPETYSPESLPKNILLETPYGSFKAQAIRGEDNKIIYIQNIDIYSGKYDPAEYKEVKSFFSEISSAIRRKLVLKKS